MLSSVVFAGASSRPSSGSSWGLVRSILTSESEAASSPIAQIDQGGDDAHFSPLSSPAEAEAQIAERLAHVDAQVEHEFAQLQPPGQPEDADAPAPARPLSVFGNFSKPRVLPPLEAPSFNSGGPFFPGGRRRGAVDMTVAAAAAAKQKRKPKSTNGALLQQVHAQKLRAHKERLRAASSPQAQAKRVQAETLAVFAANSKPAVTGRVGQVRQMGQRITLGDPAMTLGPSVALGGNVTPAVDSSTISDSGGGIDVVHCSGMEVLQKLGSLAAEVANEEDPAPQPALMKKLLAAEMERKREARWRAAQPKGTVSSRAMQKTRNARKKNGDVNVKALRDAF